MVFLLSLVLNNLLKAKHERKLRDKQNNCIAGQDEDEELDLFFDDT